MPFKSDRCMGIGKYSKKAISWAHSVFLLSGVVLLLSARSVMANPIPTYVDAAELVGEARMTYLFFKVYDARLYATKGQWRGDQPYALHLAYLRDLSGRSIADRSVVEIREQGFEDEIKLAGWHEQMREIFPDVSEGVALLGISDERGYAVFYLQDESGYQRIGEVADKEFAQRFFGIWLDPKTSEPDLRKQLLGLSQ